MQNAFQHEKNTQISRMGEFSKEDQKILKFKSKMKSKYFYLFELYIYFQMINLNQLKRKKKEKKEQATEILHKIII